MATQRQKKAARLVVENLTLDKPLTSGEIVENSGYGVSMKKNPQVILKSEGVQEELAILGFDEKSAKEVVGQILLTGENDSVKLKASEMIFKVYGTFAPDKSINVNYHRTEDSKLDEIVARVEAELDEPKGTT